MNECICEDVRRPKIILQIDREEWLNDEQR
jgi:hypothetical protein